MIIYIYIWSVYNWEINLYVLIVDSQLHQQTHDFISIGHATTTHRRAAESFLLFPCPEYIELVHKDY